MQSKINGLNLRAISAVLPSQKVSTLNFCPGSNLKEGQRIVMGTGIETVYIADKDLLASDLCELAAFKLCDDLQIDRSEIDGLVFITQTPDRRLPATSVLLQNRLKLKKNLVTFDINSGCSGYIYGLYQAAMLIAAGGCERILVCAGDVITHYLDPNDYKSRMMLGDCGSATLIEKGTDSWVFDFLTDSYSSELEMYHKNYEFSDPVFFSNGKALLELALKELGPTIERLIKAKKWDMDSLSHIVLSQTNLFVLNFIRKKLGITAEKFLIAIKNYGNTGPASIPLTLCDHKAKSKQLKFDNTVLGSLGTGGSIGGCALNLSKTYFSEITFHPQNKT